MAAFPVFAGLISGLQGAQQCGLGFGDSGLAGVRHRSGLRCGLWRSAWP